MASLMRVVEMVNVWVNVGDAANPVVVLKMPPSLTAFAPKVLTSKLFGFPGSNMRSEMRRFPVPGVSRLLPALGTASFWNVTEAGADVAFADR